MPLPSSVRVIIRVLQELCSDGDSALPSSLLVSEPRQRTGILLQSQHVQIIFLSNQSNLLRLYIDFPSVQVYLFTNDEELLFQRNDI